MQFFNLTHFDRFVKKLKEKSDEIVLNKRATQTPKGMGAGWGCVCPPPPTLVQNHTCTWSKMKFVTLECDSYGESVQGMLWAIRNRNDLLDLVAILVSRIKHSNWAGRTVPYISSIQKVFNIVECKRTEESIVKENQYPLKIQSKFASRKNKFLREWIDRTIRLLIKLLEQNVENHNSTMLKGGGSFIINRDLLKPLCEKILFSSFNPFSLVLFFRSKKSRLHSLSQDPSSVTSQIRRSW